GASGTRSQLALTMTVRQSREGTRPQGITSNASPVSLMSSIPCEMIRGRGSVGRVVLAGGGGGGRWNGSEGGAGLATTSPSGGYTIETVSVGMRSGGEIAALAAMTSGAAEERTNGSAGAGASPIDVTVRCHFDGSSPGASSVVKVRARSVTSSM